MTLFLFIFSTLISQSLLSEEKSSCSGYERSLDTILEIGTVQSLVVARNGTTRAEIYGGAMHGSRYVNIKSASKSVLSLLIGIALDKGYIDDVEVSIGSFFPDFFEANPDSIKESITLRDLLTMQSGLETTSFRNYGRWVLSSNWTEFVLSQPLVAEPGSRMIYSTGTSHLLSVILSRSTGISTREFADKYLFHPLGVTVGGWDRDPQGYYMGGNNLALTPMALLRIGELMLNTGLYDGERIVSRKWILESTRIYTMSNFNPYHYGYMWWRKNVSGTEVFFAWGNGGQYIFILPEFDAVLSVTSALRSNASRNYQREIFRFMEETMLPYLACIKED